MKPLDFRLACASSLALLGLGLPVRAQCDEFALTPSFRATGSQPVSVAAGDLDGDGHVDLVVADVSDETVALLFGTGGAAFASGVLVPAGSAPRAVALGDLDGDSDLDVAVCNAGYQDGLGWHGVGLTVLWNSGGVFSSSSFSALPPSETQPAAVALGDFDGDDDLDVALAAHGTGYLNSHVASFLNDGTGQFAAPLLAATGYDPVALELGDLDGDGTLDAVTVNSFQGTISVLRGVGDGTFVQAFGHATGAYPLDVTLGDFDEDGGLDAAVAYRYGVHVLHGNGFQLDWLATLSAGFFPGGVGTADFDGDNHLDLAAVDYLGSELFVWMGDGASQFTPYLQTDVSQTPVALLATDLDADGDPDLTLAAASAGGVDVFRNDCMLGTYCAGKVNSAGCTPVIGFTGTPTFSGADDFHVTASDELNGKSGMVFFGLGPAALPFSGGTLCVQPPLKRTSLQNSGGTVGRPDCTGTYDFHVSYAWLAAQGWSAGIELFGQYWGRDPQHADGSGASLSDAVRFVFQP